MLKVTSEVGRLRRVLVHEPGLEVDHMVPLMMEDLLFDDILYGDRARNEHARFRRVLQLFGVEVLNAGDLLTETLAVDEAREWIVEEMLIDLPSRVRERLSALEPAELATLLVAGLRRDGVSGALDPDRLYHIPPVPNFCFQRDTQIVIGDGVVFSSMATQARYREALLSRTVFRYHPDFVDVPVIHDPLDPQSRHGHVEPQRRTIEGGDVLILSPDVVAVGLSERTNRAGVRQLARALMRRERPPRYLVVVDLPRRRAYMHLDTLFTAIDRDLCLAFPPVIAADGVEAATVYTVDLHAQNPDFSASSDGVLESLRALGCPLEPVPCGGDDPVSQQREQWTDGANSLAVAPGLITLFERNTATSEELARRGFRIVDSEDLLLGRAEVDADSGERVCVLLRSNEISRARGGPHCLSHPLERDAL